MTVIDKAVEWAVRIAEDPAHGYDQGNRWGPDYDCSSLVISAWRQAGIPLASTYTGNMLQDLLDHGFKIVKDISRKRGDVLLAHNDRHQHTAMMVNDSWLVQASQNERGGILGGQTGDQTGGEINLHAYYDMPWDYVLRYSKEEPAAAEESSDTYTVQKGDTMYAIAARFGTDIYALAKLNSIPDPSMIYPGQVLQLKAQAEGMKEEPADPEIREYVIQPGDTLSGIAYQKYGRWNYYFQLAAYNGLQNAHQIYVGQKINIPPVKVLLNL